MPETRQSEIEALKAEIEQLKALMTSGNSSKFTIPDPIKNVSEFSGSKKELSSWLREVDELYEMFKIKGANGQPDSLSSMYIRAIKNKIRGDARAIVCANGDPDTIVGIKQILLEQYSDRFDFATNVSTLFNIKKSDKSHLKFFNECKEINTRLKSNLNSNPITGKEIIDILTVTRYLDNIGEPLSAIIRLSKPKTLEDAYESVCINQNAEIRSRPAKSQFNKFPNKSNGPSKFHANEVDVDNDDDDDDDEDDNVQETYEKLDKTFNSLLDNEQNLEKVTFDSLDSLNFIFEIDELLYYLEIIEESITLAGRSIPSSRIIHPEELSVIRHTLNDNGFRLNSVDDMLNIASAYAVYNNEMFMYILKIPKIKDVQYKIGLIEPVIANNLRIHLTAQFYIEGQNAFMSKNPCPKMKDLSICSSICPPLEPPTECIQQLVSGQHTAKCPMERIYEAKTIRKITEGNIMVTGSNITLSSNCSSERLLNGSFLIQYSNCTVKLDDEEYANSDMEIQPFIPTTGIKVSPTILINNIPLQHLQEMNLEHRNQIYHLSLTTNNLHWKLHMFGWLTSLSTTVIIICILGLIIAIIFKIFSWRKHLTLNTKEDIHINFSLATDGCPESRDIPLIPQQ
ncbi:LOW QUALITY PROTEIN: uncharacterized protein LOC134216039 [Armigeres subalbatus]|uniref:LOW QUALITY PROTEIN: uncharacterized protein LOC134216039 n=1 Tax=Armigeres subalbatus TaxID=124917 RepID=UPI002ED0D530